MSSGKRLEAGASGDTANSVNRQRGAAGFARLVVALTLKRIVIKIWMHLPFESAAGVAPATRSTVAVGIRTEQCS